MTEAWAVSAGPGFPSVVSVPVTEAVSVTVVTVVPLLVRVSWCR